MTIDDVYSELNALLRSVNVPAPTGTYYGGAYALADKALVIPCFSLKGKRETWGAQLVSPNDRGRIHAWFFSQTDTLFPERRTRGGQLHGEWVITLYGYLEQRDNTHTDNSDLDFNREADQIERAINADPTTMATVLRSLRPFRLRRDVDLLGNKSVHVAVGDIIIKSC